MKVLISGSRTITDFEVVAKVIKDSPFTITQILHGGANGVDILAGKWARRVGIPVRIFIPEWKKLGKKAGIFRNQQMVKEADGVIAIWDGSSKGTKSVIDYSRKCGKPLYIYQSESIRVNPQGVLIEL